VPPTKGAKKPILSSEFCDRIQVGLIDMRAMRKRDIYGNMQRWIMTVKDHSTGLVYLCALQQKTAFFVAAKLEKYFRLIGYPKIFHTGMFTDGGIGYFSGSGSGSDGRSGIGLGSGISSVDVSAMAVQAAVTGVTSVAMAAIKDSTVRNTPPLSNLTPTCQLTFDSPQPVVNEPPSTELETFHASEFCTFIVQEAWDHGNIACFYQTLSSREEFKFL